VHSKGANSIAMSELGCRKASVGVGGGGAVSLLFCLKGFRNGPTAWQGLYFWQ